MSIGWIYAFQDTGYERGIKVGRDGSKNGLAAWEAVPCYSPREMLYLASWRIEFPFTRGATFSSAAELERNLHNEIGGRLDFPRNGREWFDLTATEAAERISDRLGRKPDGEMRHI